MHCITGKKIMLICPKDVTFNFRKELIEKLIKLDNAVFLVSPYGESIKYYQNIGCQHIDCKIDRRGTSIINDIKLIIDYYKILKKFKPDAVLTYTTKCSVYGGIASGILNIPFIVNTAGLMQKGDRLSFLEKFILFLYKISFRKASCLMYQNSYEEMIVNKTLNNKVHFRRIPGSGVNLEKYNIVEYPIDNGIIRFNFVARIMKSKGIDEYLECAIEIKKEFPNTEFYIYGDYDDDKYKEKIDDLIKQGIVIYGGVQKDMKSYIEKAHAVIHPSYYEGMTNVILEHSSMGRPSLGSNIPGVQDAIDDGVSGFVFKVRDSGDLIEKTREFINLSYEDKMTMGLNARKKMEKEFDRNIIVNIYLEELEKVII